jgi:hypothetical protein
MSGKGRVLVFGALLLGVPLATHAQAWSGLLAPSRAIDWSQTGIPGGVPTNRTQCGATVNAPGSSVDATASIQNALNACQSNQYVLLAPGTFLINSSVTVPSNVTLRGSGADQSILDCHGSGDACIVMGSGSVGYTGVLNITGGNTAGSTSLTLNGTAGVSVGGLLVISEINDTANFVTNAGGEGSCTWCDGWSTNGTRARGQIVEVTSLNGNVVGITPGLYSNYPSANSPTAVPFSASVRYAGVENLQINENNTGYTNNLAIHTCAYCWIKGVQATYTDGDFIDVRWSYRNEIRDNYCTNAYHHAPGTTDSDIFIVLKTSASKIENNIVERGHSSIMINWGSAGNVIAYNYTMGEFDSADNFMNGGIQFHGAHPQFNLIEGNVTTSIYPDQVWGSSSRNTTFRNWSLGTSMRCTPYTGRGPVSCSGSNGIQTYQASRAMQIAHLSTSYNLVGDIVGSAQQQALKNTSGTALAQTAVVAYPASRSYEGVAYGYSWGYGESNDSGSGTGCSGGVAPCNSTDAFTTGFLHGEFTNVDGLISWATGVTQALPASFYLSAKPAWWPAAMPWPAIGPDVTGGTGPGGHVFSKTAGNAAQYCYTTIMGGADGGAGSPLTFNAARCYSSASANAPNPPAGLAAVVQ